MSLQPALEQSHNHARPRPLDHPHRLPAQRLPRNHHRLPDALLHRNHHGQQRRSVRNHGNSCIIRRPNPVRDAVRGADHRLRHVHARLPGRGKCRRYVAYPCANRYRGCANGLNRSCKQHEAALDRRLACELPEATEPAAENRSTTSGRRSPRHACKSPRRIATPRSPGHHDRPSQSPSRAATRPGKTQNIAADSTSGQRNGCMPSGKWALPGPKASRQLT